LSEVLKWSFVGDLQMPYHDRRAVALFMKAMKSWKPDIIDVVGDIDDQLEYSTFSDGTTDDFFNKLKKEKKLMIEESNGEEREETDEEFRKRLSPLPFITKNALAARSFYSDIRKQHSNAEIHASLGNHDIRIFKYIDRKAPDYIDQITPNMLWGLDDLGITWRHYDVPPLERYAGIHVHHGATTTTTGLAVRTDIETYNISLVRGHDHRGGVVYKSYPMTKSSLAGMGTGHLCDPSGYGLKYAINPSWEQGFGIAHIVDGKAHLSFIPMRDYVCVLDGKVFKG